ncbi:hypothetical protein B4Q13_25055, partial [Lacticaseibacillus rhamnosus]
MITSYFLQTLIGFSMYGFLRYLGNSRAAALVGGIAYTYNSFTDYFGILQGHYRAAALAVACIAMKAAASPDPQNFSLVEKGRYLAIASDCAACHDAADGRPYAGGRPIETPFDVGFYDLPGFPGFGDEAVAMAIDEFGGVFVTGNTRGSFPTTAGAFQEQAPPSI